MPPPLHKAMEESCIMEWSYEAQAAQTSTTRQLPQIEPAASDQATAVPASGKLRSRRLLV